MTSEKTKPAPKPKRRWYKLWLNLHLYSGLSIGLVFVLTGLTGSLLVFYVELDEILNPELQITEQQAQQPPQSFEALYQAVRKVHPERTGAWRFEIPRHNQAMMMARYYKAKEKEHVHFAPLMVWLNPYTAVVISSRFWGDFIMTWIYDLHYTLLLDKTGKIAMGVIGLLLLVTVFIGLYLWWPKTGKFKSALTFKANASRERFHYDLHKVIGVYDLILLVLLLFSGALLELPDYLNPVINKLSPLSKVGDYASSSQENRRRLPVDVVVMVAMRAFPEAKLRWIETPNNPQDSYNIRLYQKGEPSLRFPKTIVWIDQYSGEVLATKEPAKESAGDVFLNWMHPLHSGEIAGMSGRILVAISGFIPVLLFYTGFARWRQKHHAKRQKVKKSVSII